MNTITDIEKLDTPFEKEYLKIEGGNIIGKLSGLVGKSGDHFIGWIPSLNTSGYGDSHEEALEDLKYNLHVHMTDLSKLPVEQIHKALISLGWQRHKRFKKKYSSTYIDENGYLQNFNSVEEIKRESLSAMVA